MGRWTGPGSEAAANTIVHFWLCHTVHLCMGSVSGAVHIDLAVKVLWFVYWEANSHPGCMNGLRKRYSHLVGGLFLVGKTVFVLNECCRVLEYRLMHVC